MTSVSSKMSYQEVREISLRSGKVREKSGNLRKKRKVRERSGNLNRLSESKSLPFLRFNLMTSVSSKMPYQESGEFLGSQGKVMKKSWKKIREKSGKMTVEKSGHSVTILQSYT